MNLQGIILLIIVGVVVVGGGVYLVTSSPTDSDDVVIEEKMTSDDDVSGEGTLRALLALGKNLTCDFVHDDPESGRSEGTVYLSGERMRGDFTITANGTVMESHVIRDGDTGYTWGSTPAGTMAITFTISEEEQVVASGKSEQSINLDQNLEYSCTPWNVDESKFQPPADLNFQDISAQMQVMQEGSASVKGAQCGACEQIPDASSKAQCKVALGCS